MTNENDAGPPDELVPEGQAPEALQSIWRPLLVPVVLIALLILGGTFTLIGAAILGWDNGVLGRMADSRFARGLITYLFATVTIGTAILLIVAALTAPVTKQEERRFERGKEVLSLLLGLFGTIVGFYFGSELGKAGPETSPLELTAPLLGSTQLAPGQKTTITAHVNGGMPPYWLAVRLKKDAPLDYLSAVGADGWIVTDIVAPEDLGPDTKFFSVTLGVRDATGQSVAQTTEVRLTH